MIIGKFLFVSYKIFNDVNIETNTYTNEWQGEKQKRFPHGEINNQALI